jgi:hypothetical protein
VVALVVSSVFENFLWTGLTVAGIALAILGNIVALWPGSRATRPVLVEAGQALKPGRSPPSPVRGR